MEWRESPTRLSTTTQEELFRAARAAGTPQSMPRPLGLHREMEEELPRRSRGGWNLLKYILMHIQAYT